MSLNSDLADAVKGLKTPQAIARALHAVLRRHALAEGQKPDIEVFMRQPGEPRHFDDATCWVVAWEAGPYEWAISASFAVGEACGRLVEPYYSFDLCIYKDR